MDKKKHDELILISEKTNYAWHENMKEYYNANYAGMKDFQSQMKDSLFAAKETSVRILGYWLALIDEDDREREIRDFMEQLRQYSESHDSSMKIYDIDIRR